MRRAKVAENLALFGLVLVASACAPAHRVSPWGERPPPLGALLRAPDLAARLAEIDAETAHLGLARTIELEAKLPAARGAALVRAYEGADVVGRRVTAIRAASSRGVILALGPLDARDLARDQATELVPALAPADDGDPAHGAWRSGTDLDGDGLPDVVARTEQGALEIWSLDVFGANRYPVELEAPPTSAIDADGDGRPDLVGRVPVPAGDPIAPVLEDVATAAPGGFSHATAAARAWHAARARDVATLPLAPPGRAEGPAKAGAADAKAQAARPEPEEARVARAIVAAWHRALAGEPRDAALAALDKQRPSPALRASFEAWRRRVERVAPEPAAPPRDR
jgi:hypothetical protein